jgi:hypothetical protein
VDTNLVSSGANQRAALDLCQIGSLGAIPNSAVSYQGECNQKLHNSLYKPEIQQQ